MRLRFRYFTGSTQLRVPARGSWLSMHSLSRAVILVLLASSAADLYGADYNPKPLATDPLADVAPLAALVEFAAGRHIPIAGITVAGEGATPRKGDAATLLVTLFDGRLERQWLARLEADDLTADERQMKPLPEGVMFSGTGRTWRYPVSRTALNVVFIGPFFQAMAPGYVPREKHERVLTSPEYLSCGLDQYCRVEMSYRQRLKDAGIRDAWIGYWSVPGSADIIKMGQRVAAQINFTPDEDRIRTEGGFPVVSFVEIATEIPAFKSVLVHVLDMPSV